MSVWGTCAGAIFIARDVPGHPHPLAELMDIRVRRNAFGRQLDSFEADIDVPALGDVPFHAVFIRAPLIEAVGPGVDVLSRLDGKTIVAARQGVVNRPAVEFTETQWHATLAQQCRHSEDLLTVA